ncbi:unnamed protein product [marine sediment metagenome]|uniref:Uncharacterized protein n=1 Tax=marine sediment metagenome TaxID=412755 RepID=X1UEB3_9ZZZZ
MDTINLNLNDGIFPLASFPILTGIDNGDIGATGGITRIY